MNRSAISFLLLLTIVAGAGRAEENSFPQMAEPNPPLITNANPARITRGLSAGPTLYIIGEPTDDEQLYLELINRARANPPAEGQWLAQLTDPDVLSAIDFFGVNLTVLVDEFNAISPSQPLAFSAPLIMAARKHSALMFTNEVQSHQITSVEEPPLDQRVMNEGYPWASLGENVYSYAQNTIHGHAGFQIDWGPGDNGMQTGRGHRVNIHNPSFREVGIGIYEGINGTVGPQLVTQDFGTSQNSPFLTGVVYHDFDADEFYDLGEGLGGVTVEVTGNQHFAISAGSGGYTIPLPGDGVYAITFTAANGGSFSTNVTVSGGQNVKVDWRPVYQVPVLSGPARPVSGFNMTYSFTTPIGLTNYSWQVLALASFSFTDNADNGLNNFTALTDSYSVTGADTVVDRSSVFHLAHPGPPGLQTLELSPAFIPKAGATLRFQSRLALATTNQVPVVQVSQNGGLTWTDVWELIGGSSSHNSPYQEVVIDLSALGRLETKLRFAYTYIFRDMGTYYDGTDYQVGWMFDDIQLTGVDSGSAAGGSAINNTSQFQFTASSPGNYLVYLKPSVTNRDYPGSNILEIQSVTEPTLTIGGLQMVPSKKFDVSFSHAASGLLKVYSAPIITGPWTLEAGTSFETLTADQSFRVTLPMFTGHRFYRVGLAPQ